MNVLTNIRSTYSKDFHGFFGLISINLIDSVFREEGVNKENHIVICHAM